MKSRTYLFIGVIAVIVSIVTSYVLYPTDYVYSGEVVQLDETNILVLIDNNFHKEELWCNTSEIQLTNIKVGDNVKIRPGEFVEPLSIPPRINAESVKKIRFALFS